MVPLGPLCSQKFINKSPKPVIFAHFCSFVLIFAVFDLSRPPEGHYDPCVVLRHDNQVVYGVELLCST